MTEEKLAQVEAAKAALPLAMEPVRGLPQYEARRLVTTAAPVLVERVIELEEQLRRYEWVLAETEALVLSHEGHIAKQDAQIAALKEWQGKAVEHLGEWAECIRCSIPEYTGARDSILALIAQAQKGEKA